MPPTLGGCVMRRSYDPSEWHADYCDCVRVEALKPAIEACGISTLSQAPRLGCHMLFFFSSRRRHTRCSRDWSSDVCSSDLGPRASSARRGDRCGTAPGTP